MQLNDPPTEIEIANVLLYGGLTETGQMIIRRLAFECDRLKEEVKELKQQINEYRAR